MEEEGSGEGGDSVKESTYHRWAYLSLRYTCVQIVRGRWPVSILFDCSNEIKKFLLLRLLENCLDGGMVQCQVVELATILNCFLGLVSESAVGELPERECVTFPRSEDCWEAESPTPKLWLLDVPVFVGTAKDIEAMDEASMLLGGSDVVWKYLYGALRFQCVSTENAHGGLSICNVLQVGARKGIHFVGIRAITVPQSVHLASEHGASDVVLKVQYAAHSDKAQQVRSLSQLLKESSASYPLAASDMLRYCYARRVLYVLSLLEQHMVLRDYACSPEEAKWVPLTDILFFSRHVEDESVFAESRSDLDSRRDGRKGNETATWTQRPVTTVGILPPDAVNLMRYNAARADESDAVDRIDGPSPDSLRLMIGNMLMHIATCEQPTLIEMYTIGEATYKQGLQEASKMEEGTLDSGNVTNDSRSFIDRRQGEAAVNGSAKLESISTPILSTIDRYMSSDAFEKVLLKAEVALRRQSAQHLMTTPRSSVARNVPKRRETDMKDKDFSFSPRAMLGSISPGLHGRFSITSPKVLFSQRSGLMSSITTIMSSRSTGNHAIRAAPRLS
ncbi:unnamed protein product [Trypanosoma congolense IL3000]|uniref:WGS project CAEQ00000000 data, annotated contig 1696 n=1 Tax=Trypanosoma congolense (strain IL3000) TaxID=1068625 RepID=F9W831_TRYCI|nr:unnamed protein product [Trypanosoma congolense IL3000]